MTDQLVAGMQNLRAADMPVLTTSISVPSTSDTDMTMNTEEQQAHAGQMQAKEPLFELLPIQGKGMGLFAVTNIARGTCIIEEAPLLSIMPYGGEPGKLSIPDIQRAVKNLTPRQRDAYFGLYRNREHTAWCIASVAASNGGQLTDWSHIETVEALITFSTNSVDMGPNLEYGSGVFENYSRVNHSCAPNVQNHYNPTLGLLTVHAIKQINKGEEILTSYIDSACRTQKQRSHALGIWGFQCECRCCTGPKAAASGIRRERMYALDQAFEYDAEAKRDPTLPILMAPDEGLRLAEELLELHRSEGLADYNLAICYRECSKFSLALGQFDKAVDYAKKERDVERYCIGTETAHLEKDLDGTKYWLEHVVGKREEAGAKRTADEKALKKKMAHEMAPKSGKGGKGKKK